MGTLGTLIFRVHNLVPLSLCAKTHRMNQRPGTNPVWASHVSQPPL